MLSKDQETLFTTPKKSGYLVKTNSASSNFTGSNDLFKSTNYQPFNFNSLIESDFKFKSPNKLLNIKISESPWISNQKRNKFLNPFFEPSPKRYSNFKIRFCDTIKQESRVTSYFGETTTRKISNAFELEKENNVSLNPVKEVEFELRYAEAKRKLEKVARSVEREETEEKTEENDENSSCKSSVRKRRRKTGHQLKVLKDEFEKDSNWTKEHITYISKITGLSESQVYKWCWDQKKKVDEDEKDEGIEDVRKKAIFCDSIPLYKNIGEKIGKKIQEEEEPKLGKRRPFGLVNDSRIHDQVVKKIKI